MCIRDRPKQSPADNATPLQSKLGHLLFAIMVNDLVSLCVPRAKYVDELTVLEVVPRNTPSMLNFIVNEIEPYAISNNMRLSPSKSKELFVSFLRIDLTVAAGSPSQ